LEQHGMPSRDGMPLHLRCWRGAERDPSRAVLCFVHGFADHGGRYRLPAEHFAALGHVCYAVDYRGHGKAGGRRGHVDSFRRYLDDVEAFLTEVRSREGASAAPLVVVAHSQGALILCHYLAEAGRPAPSAAILTSPAIGVAMKVPAWKALPARLLSDLRPTVAFPTEIDVADLTHDDVVVCETRQDPLYGRSATARWFTEFLAAQDRSFTIAAHIRTPVLVVQAGDDRIVSAAQTRRLVARMPADCVTYREMPGMYHEVLNETDRATVYGLMADWLATRLARAA
jgi:alpha-beta hydrolase superfamily lysophospholipase